MKGQMTHIETIQTRTNYFKFPAKFRNYRRVLLIMTIKSVNDSRVEIKLDDGQAFEQLSVGVDNSAWNRTNPNQFTFLVNTDEPARIQLEIVPYKYNTEAKTELKMLYDNDVDEINSRIQLSHLTFKEHIDNIVLEASTANGEIDISYVAYGELE